MIMVLGVVQSFSIRRKWLRFINVKEVNDPLWHISSYAFLSSTWVERESKNIYFFFLINLIQSDYTSGFQSGFLETLVYWKWHKLPF